MESRMNAAGRSACQTSGRFWVQCLWWSSPEHHSSSHWLTRVLLFSQVKLSKQRLKKQQNSVWSSRSRRRLQRRCLEPWLTFDLLTLCLSCVIALLCFFSLQDCAKIAESVQKSVLTLSTVYFWLPKSRGNWPVMNSAITEFQVLK